MSTEELLLPSRRRDVRGAARRAEILRLLEAGDELTVEQLAERFGVSLATMRRDLTRLRQEYGVTRTYGGATLARPRDELPVRQRATTRRAAKDAIGRLAAAGVADEDVLIVDAGTTTESLARHLEAARLTVFTNGIGTINALLEKNHDVSVIVLGGRLRHTNETIAGAEAEAMLRHVYATTAFIGAEAVDPRLGIASRTLDQCRIKSLMMTQAKNVVVLADSSKLQGGYFNYWSPLPASWCLITDDEASPEAVEVMRESGASEIRQATVEPEEAAAETEGQAS
ncbi:DeoR/GlpR family DNA-binding transcription regulator [Georgenia sp. TF02-10]|uniref:DeoR/GlpR family DNA-binding transcription regulator n=1 Tax=Georgenia sp. TF02-10 TaxID=2917725 RepID=UPI001FA719A6|nr:DeoR/GlpR family DNA-binding transcription regulator [Georgenia sp. TF02-10]UNX55391.1 DeoR/GlpR family DNA-binding transcription regulator [Georgenia sp. TF02-10]